MIGCGDRESVGRIRLELTECAGLSGHDALRRLSERRRPGGAVAGHVPLDLSQVVDDIAAAEDQDALIAQRCQRGPESHVLVK